MFSENLFINPRTDASKSV